MNQSIYTKGFKSYLQLERGMSHNTVVAYLYDVGLLFSFLNEECDSTTILDVTSEDLKKFIVFINKLELGPYTQSRVISGIKAFFRYLILEKIIKNDPSEMLESPKLGRKLPDVLTPDEVETIINSVDSSATFSAILFFPFFINDFVYDFLSFPFARFSITEYNSCKKLSFFLLFIL